MFKLSYVLSVMALVVCSTASAELYFARPICSRPARYCQPRTDDGVLWTPQAELTSQIPAISVADTSGKPMSQALFKLVPDVAQYKQADWSQAIGIARGISVEEAMTIAKSNPNITYFFRTKGLQMVLEQPDGNYRRFGHGDTVFFSGEPWFGSAPNLADGYVKQ